MSTAPRPGRAIYVIARRELNSRLRARSFVVSTLLSLAVLVAFVLAQSTLFDNDQSDTIGLNGQAIAIAEPLIDAAEQAGRQVDTVEVTDLAAGREAVADGDLDVLVSGAPAELSALVNTELDEELRGVLNGLAQQQVLRGQLAAVEGLSVDDVLATVAGTQVAVQAITPVDPQEDQRLALALVMVALLYFTLLLYGSLVAQGVVEEKSGRVVEVLLASVRPWQLLSGKVLGLGLVGLIQLAVIGVTGLLLALLTGVLTIGGTAIGTLAWGLFWYSLGHLLYATVFAAVGSLVSRQEDVQTVLMPVTITLVVAFALGFAMLSRNPSSTANTVLSLVPPLSPILIPGRIALGTVPFWQVALAILLTGATIALVARIGSVVHRNSVLHTGPRLRLRKALRPKQ